MRVKNKEALFICQFTESRLKVVKCLPGKNHLKEFTGFEAESLVSGGDEKNITEILGKIFKKLAYKNDPVIVCLPRGSVTCRYLKVPARDPQEIEGIVSLQASRYLPYPSEELISGYQVISTDKEGYSDTNVVIARREAIERYLNIFKGFKSQSLSVVISSFGIYNLYRYVNPKDTGPAILIDIDSQLVDLGIIFRAQLVFSRSFKFSSQVLNWEKIFVEEIDKTRDAYLKEIPGSAVNKAVILGSQDIHKRCADILSKQASLTVEVVSYLEKIRLSQCLSYAVMASEDSFASLLGVGLSDVPDSLNLLPQSIKQEAKTVSLRKEYLRLGYVLLASFLIFSGAIIKSFDNKAEYLSRLRADLGKIAREAQPLEVMDKRLKLMDGRLQKKPSTLEILQELYRIMPGEVFLTNLIYEEDRQAVLDGQAPELNSLSALVSLLEKSEVFKNFDVKIKYATQKKDQLFERVDFEIVCARK